MKLFRASVILIFVLCITVIAPVYAQDQDMAAVQKAWQEYMTPSEGHNILAAHAGEWKTVTTMWMDPNQPPQKYEGEAKSEMIMGGRYLKATFTGNMMGMPFEGMSLEGFDNAKKEYTSVWIDNFGTGTSISTGKYDKKTKSIVYKGTVYDPMIGKETVLKQVVKNIDKDHHVIEMYQVVNGTELKTMEVSFERKM